MTATARKRDGYWQVDIIARHPITGALVKRERRKAPGTMGKAEALRWAQRREMELLDAIVNPEKAAMAARPEAPTFDAFWPDFVRVNFDARRRKHSTKRAAESIRKAWLSPRFGAVRLDAITPAMIVALKGAMVEAGLAAKTSNNVIVVLSRVLKVARDMEHLTALPRGLVLDKVDTGKAPDALPPALGDAYVKAAEGHGPHDLAIVLLGLDAGLRRGEVVALDCADVAAGKLTIARASYRGVVATTKGGKTRTVPMTPRLAGAVAAVRGPRASGRLFVDLTDEGVRWVMEKVEEKCGIPANPETGKRPGRFHVLRHTFCSTLAARGVPAVTIQRLAGHVSIETTQKYLHVLPGAAEAAIAALAAGTTEPRGTTVERPRLQLQIVNEFAT